MSKSLLTYILNVLCLVAQLCLTLCSPMDCGPAGSSVHGIFQARILEQVAISYSRGSSQPKDRTGVSCVSCMGRWIFFFLPLYHLGSPINASVQFSRLVVSNSLQPHELQPPCPSPTPEFTQTQTHRVSDAIQPSHPLSSPSPPAPNPSQHQNLFQ